MLTKNLKKIMPKTLYNKLVDSKTVGKTKGGDLILRIDKQLVHEVTSSFAFDEARQAGIDKILVEALATPDHNIPTDGKGIQDPDSRSQVDTLEKNVKQFNVNYFSMKDKRQGIVHVIGPEQGFTLPGDSIVCGDSHTATHGALGALAFGIGSSEISISFRTGCLILPRLKSMRIVVNGKLSKNVTPKDVILYIIGQIGVDGGTGYAIEFSGDVFRDMSIEGRMTVANMAIEAQATVGLFEVDDKTIDYIKGRPKTPKGKGWELLERKARTLYSDPGAHFDKEHVFDASDIKPQVTWGTNPGQVCAIDGEIPDDANLGSLAYMDLKKGTKAEDIFVSHVFIGSCTNSRIEDLRLAAHTIRRLSLKKHDSVELAFVVPGSGLVKEQAEKEGLDKIFIKAGFEWRNPGCSACLAMNNDKIPAGAHCASTSNRNFEGRQGFKSRTHLCSPLMAVLAAAYGHFVNPNSIV